jgi:hypothetical protein
MKKPRRAKGQCYSLLIHWSYGQQNNLKDIHERNKAIYDAVCQNMPWPLSMGDRCIKRQLREILDHPDALATVGPEGHSFVRVPPNEDHITDRP